MFASKHKLMATGAAGVLALAVATQSTAKAPANQTQTGVPHNGHVKLPRRSPARSDAVARYGAAYRKAEQSGVTLPRDLAGAQDTSTADLRQAAARLAGAAAAKSSSGAGGGYASPESYGVSQGTLDSIAACESGGNPAAVSSDGTYRGKYQFDNGTWASMGGSGDPAAAPEAEQDMRAAMLYAQAGSSPWPICG